MSAAADDAAVCAATLREQDFARYAATLFAPPPQRRGLTALFAFAGELARVREQISQPMPGEIRLQWWHDALAGEGHGGIQGHPVLAELIRAVAEFDLPVADLLRLVEAWRFDLYDDAMADEAALFTQLDDSFGTLYGLAARICGAADGAGPLAQHAGRADGLGFVLTALPRHAARHQLYLPADLLAVNGADTADLFAGRASAGLQRVLAYLAHRAEAELNQASRALAEAAPAVRPAVLPLAALRRRLAGLADGSSDPFRQPVPSRLALLWAAWRVARKPARL
jgi:phytoene synthase